MAFKFLSNEIELHKNSKIDWYNFVRRREAEMIFSLFQYKFSYGLEIGAGDGGQSVTIAKFCDYLICTELDENSHSWLGKKIVERKLKNVEYKLCDAQDLSIFEDKQFDLIFSSNVLEHVPDIYASLKECKRVLHDDGIMLHSMPNRIWKFFNYILHFVVYRRQPRVHGVSKSHWEEFISFGKSSWLKKFKNAGLKVERVVKLPFYVGHGNRFIPIIKFGNKIGLSATYLYVIKK